MRLLLSKLDIVRRFSTTNKLYLGRKTSNSIFNPSFCRYSRSPPNAPTIGVVGEEFWLGFSLSMPHFNPEPAEEFESNFLFSCQLKIMRSSGFAENCFVVFSEGRCLLNVSTNIHTSHLSRPKSVHFPSWHQRFLT